MDNVGKQTKISRLVFFGIGSIVVAVLGFGFGGLGAGLFFGSQGSALMVLGFFILLGLAGVGMLVAALIIGSKEAFGNDNAKPVETQPDVYIMSTMIMTKQHDPVYDPDMFDDNDLRCYVQVEFPSGQKREFETHRVVLAAIGEGMRGTITYQGKWLSKFVMNRPEIKG